MWIWTKKFGDKISQSTLEKMDFEVFFIINIVFYNVILVYEIIRYIIHRWYVGSYLALARCWENGMSRELLICDHPTNSCTTSFLEVMRKWPVFR